MYFNTFVRFIFFVLNCSINNKPLLVSQVVDADHRSLGRAGRQQVAVKVDDAVDQLGDHGRGGEEQEKQDDAAAEADFVHGGFLSRQKVLKAVPFDLDWSMLTLQCRHDRVKGCQKMSCPAASAG